MVDAEILGDEATAPVTKIQATFRGHQTRKEVDKIKYDLNQKVVKDYLHKKQIPQLMQHVLSLLTYHQPEDPRSFLIEELTKTKEKAYTDLLQEPDLETMFEMVDINKTEFVTCRQLKNTMKNLGLSVPKAMLGIPDQEKMDVKQWKEMIGRNLDVLNGTRYAR